MPDIYRVEKNKIREIMRTHKGQSNPIDRVELVIKVGLADRVVRELIAEVRQEGLPVVNLGQGYFLCETPEEIETAIDKAHAYISSFQKDINGLRQAKEQMFGTQADLFEIGKRNLQVLRGVRK